ncbi:MAG TPA: NADH-quinone oxidoreductase subunit N [Thermoleophilia bacterium]|nr:NADH-quinone oxidoreductase subunit N [Thermoleophilia bacterium]
MTDIVLVLPKVAIGAAALLALLLDSVTRGRARRQVILAVVVLLLAAAATSAAGVGRTGTFLEGTLVVDRFSVFADVVLLVLAAVVVLAAMDGVGAGEDAGDFYTLLFLSLAGASLLASAGRLIMVFLAVELSIIPTFALVAFRAEDRRSFEAALKYFLLSVFASAVMLFGLSLIFGAEGSVALPLPPDTASSGLLLAGLGLVLAGFGFKLAAFPFHQWLPDAFEVAHPEVAAFLAVGPKLAAVVALVRILEGLAAESGAWTSAIAAVAVLSMVWGNLGAFRQKRIPRLLAYSAIAHAGYALIGLAGGGPRGVDGAVIYFAAYSAAAVGAFLVVGVLARGGIGDDLVDLAGLGRKRPLVAAAMTLFMLSMVGIPLFAGFWGKFSVFLGAIQGGVVWLAVVGVLNSALSFGYYGNVIRLMYLDGPTGADGGLSAHETGGWGLRVALATAAGFTMLLGVAPALLFGSLGANSGL